MTAQHADSGRQQPNEKAAPADTFFIHLIELTMARLWGAALKVPVLRGESRQCQGRWSARTTGITARQQLKPGLDVALYAGTTLRETAGRARTRTARAVRKQWRERCT